MQNGIAPVEKFWQFLKKLNKELRYDPAILLLGIYPKEPKTSDSDTHMPMFNVALFTIAKRWKKHKGLSTNK